MDIFHCITCGVNMEKLTSEQAEAIKKCSTDRLRAKLIKAGLDEEAVFAMERPKLLEQMAELTLKPVAVETKEEDWRMEDIRLRQRELELKEEQQRMEILRLEEEKKTREDQMRLESFKLEEERRFRDDQRQIAEEQRRVAEEERQRRIKWEEEMLQVKREKLKQDHQMAKMREETTESRESTLAARTKKYGDAMKYVLPRMPVEIAEIPIWFDSVEKIYHTYQVPQDLKARLMLPLLSNQAKAVIGRMNVDDLCVYEEVKGFLLKEFKLTPRELKARFAMACKKMRRPTRYLHLGYVVF